VRASGPHARVGPPAAGPVSRSRDLPAPGYGGEPAARPPSSGGRDAERFRLGGGAAGQQPPPDGPHQPAAPPEEGDGW
jgi:hypothetical protein